MDTNKILLTAGQFAKLHNINKRTLHYYDDIGLFSPAQKGENGYRYYTYQQSPVLEMLLTFRELGMSIEDIQNYMQRPSAEALGELLKSKTKKIEDTIRCLKKTKNLLIEQEEQLQLSQKVNLDEIQVVECKEEYLLLSEPISDTYDDADMASLIQYTQTQGEHRMFNYHYGTMFELEKSMTQEQITERFFVRVDKNHKKGDLFIKPAGNYIRAFSIGEWEHLPQTYKRILEFAKEQGLTLKGYAYEEGINEMAISSMKEYITQIMVRYESSKTPVLS